MPTPLQSVLETPEPTPPPEVDSPRAEEEDEKDNDEYVKLLIKEQLDERIRKIDDEIEMLHLEDEKLWER